jgi:hypothetical protein
MVFFHFPMLRACREVGSATSHQSCNAGGEDGKSRPITAFRGRYFVCSAWSSGRQAMLLMEIVSPISQHQEIS